MRIAISATGPSLDAEVDPRFGRCRYFMVVDPETLEFEAIENTSQMASGGAGIASAQLVVDKGINAVLTGNCGPNAFRVLEANRVKVITGVSGKIRNVLERYKSGRLEANPSPSVNAHFGMSGGTARGMSMNSSTIDGEIRALRDRTQMLEQHLTDISLRINELEKRNRP